MGRAAILCPGPSLVDANPDWDQYGCILAVTDAILKDAPSTHWSFAEDFKATRAVRARLAELDPVLLLRSPRKCKLGHVKVKVNVRHWAARIPWGSKGWVTDSGAKAHPALQNSFFSGLSWLLAQGPSSVDIYGQDLDGDSNFDPRTGDPIFPPSEENPRDWSQRWSVARRLAAPIYKEAESHGVKIRRHPLSGSQPEEDHPQGVEVRTGGGRDGCDLRRRTDHSLVSHGEP